MLDLNESSESDSSVDGQYDASLSLHSVGVAERESGSETDVFCDSAGHGGSSLLFPLSSPYVSDTNSSVHTSDGTRMET